MKIAIVFGPVILLSLTADPVVPTAREQKQHFTLSREVPEQARFEELCRTDPVAAIEASLAKQRRDIRGYRCIMQKQETLGGRLGKIEIIRLAVNEDPFKVLMVWQQGAGSAQASLYVAGDDGKMLVRTGLGVLPLDPAMGKGSSRYSIEDAGLKRGSLRTFKAWQTKREAGELIFDYRGKVKLPELGNRECFAIHRTIKGLEVDNFRLNDDTVRNPAKHPKEAFTAVTIYLDCETWLQVGSQLWKADGTLYASYFFRDIEINPAFGPDDFTKKALE